MNWRKNGSTALDQHYKVPILNLLVNWEKLCPNLSFTVENKMGNLHKADHISNLTSLKKEFINKLGKMQF